MKAYGVKRKDTGCCPGHDKFDGAYKNTSRKKVKAQRRPAKKRERQRTEVESILIAYPPDHPDFADFNCCGGNDETPKKHNLDCFYRAVVCLSELKAERESLKTSLEKSLLEPASTGEKPPLITLDEWVEKYAKGLANEIAVHILQLGGLSSSREESDLLRVILTSIRQWHPTPAAEGQE